MTAAAGDGLGRHEEGVALIKLGLALQQMRRFEEAIDAQQRAATIARELGDRHGEQVALSNLISRRAARGWRLGSVWRRVAVRGR